MKRRDRLIVVHAVAAWMLLLLGALVAFRVLPVLMWSAFIVLAWCVWVLADEARMLDAELGAFDAAGITPKEHKQRAFDDPLGPKHHYGGEL